MNISSPMLSYAIVALMCAYTILGTSVLSAQQQSYSLAPGKKLTLNGVIFKSGSSNIEPVGREQLSFIAQYLRSVPLDIEIVGHTDNQGNPATNQRLSAAHAQRLSSNTLPASISTRAASRQMATATRSPLPRTTPKKGAR
jgi:outer membrane protein OmpA-like peptidoglycan-associated protein